MSKPKGRKRMNYGVSIYQEAPVVVQRKRKATEISIFENGVRVIGKPKPHENAAGLAGAVQPEQVPSSTSAPDDSWLSNLMAPSEEPPQVNGQMRMEGLPMRRTRSSQRNLPNDLPPAPRFRPTMSGIAEALGVDEPSQDYSSYSHELLDEQALSLAPTFRPTISGLEEVFGKDSQLLGSNDLGSSEPAQHLPSSVPASESSAKYSSQPLPSGETTTSHLRGLSMRRTRSQTAQLEGTTSTNIPLQPTVSGILSSLLSDDINYAPLAPQNSLPLRRTRTRSSMGAEQQGSGMQKTVSGILYNLLSNEPSEGEDREDIVKSLLAACSSS